VLSAIAAGRGRCNRQGRGPATVSRRTAAPAGRTPTVSASTWWRVANTGAGDWRVASEQAQQRPRPAFLLAAGAILSKVQIPPFTGGIHFL